MSRPSRPDRAIQGTIADGIERPEQVAALSGMGCALAQGAFFARPAAAAEITLMIERGQFCRPTTSPRRSGSTRPSGEFAVQVA